MKSINNYMTKILEETLLTNDFTFGFELEAIVSGYSSVLDSVRDYFDSDDYDMDDADSDSTEVLKDYFDSFLYGQFNSHRTNKNISGDSRVHDDSSVQHNDADTDGFTFEYSSPVLKANPENFARVIHLLKQMKKDGIYTNNTCGFHHHIKFNGMTPQDLVWIYCNLATDAGIYEQITKFKDYDFYDDHFASFRDIDELGVALINRDFEKALEYITNEKYRAFRIHPQGTLEWRGPRDFLNGDNFDDIVDFYKLFNILIRRIKLYMDSKTLIDTTISKKELFDEFKKLYDDPQWSEIVNDSEEDSKSVKKFLYKFSINQYLIFKIMKNPEFSKFFAKIFSYYNYRTQILNDIKKSVDYRFYKPDELHRIMQYIKELYKNMSGMDTFHMFHELSTYRLSKYAFSEKELKEMLESINKPSQYINTLMSLCEEKIYIDDKNVIYNKLKSMIKGHPEYTSAFVYSLENWSNSIKLILDDSQLADLILTCIKECDKQFTVYALNSLRNLFGNVIKEYLPDEWNNFLHDLYKNKVINENSYEIFKV